MKIIIKHLIDNNHRSHYWYGGQCATVEHNGYVASIEAIGDVYAEYYNGKEYAARVKDKANGGNFYHVMSDYIDGDADLYDAIENDRLHVDYNNWWECFVIDPQGNFHDLMWALDSDYLDDATKEVEENLEYIIQQIEGRKE